MDEELDLDLLLSVAGGLGRWQQVDDLRRVYIKDGDCLACLKDLQRFLRRDNPEQREAFLKLGELQLVESDVAPLVTAYPGDHDLVYQALKVLTLMTMPVDADSLEAPNLPQQFAILASIKRSCLSRDLLASLMGLAAGPLSRHPHMSEADRQALQLLVTFFRNLCAIPDPPAAAGAAASATTSLQDELLLRLFEESALELVALVAAHADGRLFRGDAPALVELLHCAYDGIDPADVLAATEEAAAAHARRASAAAASAAARRAAAGRKNLATKLLQSKQVLRHGRFRATLVQTHVDTPANTYIHSVAQTNALQPLQMELETKVRPPAPRRASPALLLELKRYTETLLQGGYNVLMAQVRRELEGGPDLSRLERGDFTRWFGLASWVGAYVRLKQEKAYQDRQREKRSRKAAEEQKQQQQQGGVRAGFPADTAAASDQQPPPQQQQQQQQQDPGGGGEGADEAVSQQQQQPHPSAFGPISSTLCWDAFHLAHMVFVQQSETPARATTKDWGMLHSSAALLREGLGLLDVAMRAGTDADKHAAERLARKLLYDGTESGLLVSLAGRVRNFSSRHEPRSAACMLVEALHAVLRLYDRLTARDGGRFLVKAKKRRRGGGRRKKQPQPQEPGDGGEQQQQQQQPGKSGGACGQQDAQQQPEQQQQQQPEQQKQQQDGGDGSGAEQGQKDGQRTGAGEASPQAAATRRSASPAPAEAALAAAEAEAHSAPAGDRAASPPSAGCTDEADPQQQQQQQQSAGAAAGAGRAGPEGNGDERRSGAGAAPTAAPADDDGAEGPAPFAATAAPRRPLLEQLEEEEGGSESGDDSEDDGEGAAAAAGPREVAFDLKAALARCMATPATVHFYCWLLAGYAAGNSAALNHAICSFLWRVVLPEHLDREPLLYQLSVLRLFHQLLSDASLRGKPEHKDVLLLATRVVRGLFAKLAPPPLPVQQGDHQQQQQQQQVRDAEREARRRAAVAGMVAVELLFWKAPATVDAIGREYCLQEGEGGAAAGPRRGKRAPCEPQRPLLGPAGEERLKQLFEGLAGSRDNLERLTALLGGLKQSQVVAELRRLGLRFGSLPDWLRPRLRELYAKHQGAGNQSVVAEAIGGELPGGWRTVQVKRMLREEGIFGRRRRRGAHDDGGDDDDDDDDEGWGMGGGTGDVLFGVDRAALEELYRRHADDQDALDLIAEGLPPGPDGRRPSTADVRATLCFHGIIPLVKKRQRGAGGGAGPGAGDASRRVTKAQLLQLCEEHRDSADALNLVAMALGLPVQEVQRLMAKHHVSLDSGDSSVAGSGSSSSGDEDSSGGGEDRARARGRRHGGAAGGGRPPVGTEALAELFEKHWRGAAAADGGPVSAQEAACEAIAAELPAPASAAQVLRWLRHAGLVAPARRPGAQATGGGGGGAGAARGGGVVPEPRPLQLLGYLQALHEAHRESGSWADGPAAASWLLAKLDAAEEVWRCAGVAPGGAAPDYSLVPGGGEDLDFFCAEFSNELLEAAGVRNDSGDFFKVPGNSTPGWRGRVRDAVRGALCKLDTEEAAAAAEVVREEAAAAAARRAAADAAAAAEEEARQAAVQGVGFSRGRARGGGGAAAAAGAKGRRRKRAAAAADAERPAGRRRRRGQAADSSSDGCGSSDGGRGGSDGEVEEQQAEAAAGSGSGSDADEGMPLFGGGESDVGSGAEGPEQPEPAAAAARPAATAGGRSSSGRKRAREAAAAAAAAERGSGKRRSGGGGARQAGGGRAAARRSALQQLARRHGQPEEEEEQEEQEQQEQGDPEGAEDSRQQSEQRQWQRRWRQQQPAGVVLLDDGAEDSDLQEGDAAGRQLLVNEDGDSAAEGRPAAVANAMAAARAGRRGAVLLLDEEDDD